MSFEYEPISRQQAKAILGPADIGRADLVRQIDAGISPATALAKLGVFECMDGLCGTTYCVMSLDGVAKNSGYPKYDGAGEYAEAAARTSHEVAILRGVA